MRYASVAALMLSCGLTFGVAPAMATGNVLLPADSSSASTSSVNLGLGAAPPTTQTTTLPSSTTSVTPPTAATQPTVPTTTATDQTKAEAAFAKMPSVNILSLVSPEMAAKLPKGSIPTHIIQQPDMGASATATQSNLPYAISIGFSQQSLFGAKDVQAIQNKLGLASSQIASNCLLTVRGMMQTDKASYIIYGNSAQPTVMHYDGMIKNYLMGALALCTADINHIPPGSGYLTQSNGRFSVPLQQITCGAPTRQVTNLTITYNGTTVSQCAYK